MDKNKNEIKIKSKLDFLKHRNNGIKRNRIAEHLNILTRYIHEDDHLDETMYGDTFGNWLEIYLSINWDSNSNQFYCILPALIYTYNTFGVRASI